MRRLFLLITGFAYAQTFEVASIRPSPPSDPQVGMTVGAKGGPGTSDPGLFTCQNFSLSNLVTYAYDLPFYRLTALDWMGTARFNVSAKVPIGTTKEQFLKMLQQLLAERFKLAVHWEKKEMQTYDLVIAKGGFKLKEVRDEAEAKKDDADSDRRRAPEPMKLAPDGYPALSGGTTMAMMNGRARVMYHKQTIQFLAGILSSQVGHPVNDTTGLTGKYDIGLYWASEGGRPSASGATPLEGLNDPDSRPDLFAAIQSQLGLRLEAKKAQVDVLVVDHAEKIPTEN